MIAPMSQLPPNTAVDPELEAAAEEELAAATTLSWRALAPVVPWGDAYEGFGPAGRPLKFERGYLWRAAPGGDILCEVTVSRAAMRDERAATRSGVIKKPA